jgi:chaperonin GroEL (HSP60 family)
MTQTESYVESAVEEAVKGLSKWTGRCDCDECTEAQQRALRTTLTKICEDSANAERQRINELIRDAIRHARGKTADEELARLLRDLREYQVVATPSESKSYVEVSDNN